MAAVLSMTGRARFLGLVTAATAMIVCSGTFSTRSDDRVESGSEGPDRDGARREGDPESKRSERVGAEEIRAAIDRGVRFLLERQNPDGSWGSARRTKGLNIYAPVPGAHHAFRSGVTALCTSALLETGATDGESAGADNKTAGAALRGGAWLVENLPRLRRATPDTLYNVWGHGYGIQALVRLHRSAADASRRQRIERVIEGQIELLQRYELVNGGWGYYDFNIGTQKPAGSPTSFTTATILIALADAREIGIDPSKRLVDRALASVRRQRKPDFSYLYGEYLRFRPMRGINRPAGSLGRSQACNLALRLWDDRLITDEVLGGWLQRLLDRNLWLDIGRKRPVPHEAWFQVAGYFFYYGHYYAALCLEALQEDASPVLAERLARLLMELQEKDGSWWDFPLYDYHQPYGTAFALMSLERCRRVLASR